jgi:DNA end-binding protein Ku
MFFEAEVRAVPKVGLDGISIKAAELALAQQLLRANAAEFDHSAYVDRYQEAVSDMLDAKQRGRKVKVMPKKAAASETTDLMAALQASLGKKPTKRRSA